MPQNRGPLTGVTVVALEQAVSAPMCTRVLADFGARVIKVENPKGGDFARHYDEVVNGLAAHFVWANRGKESVTLDLKTDAGLDILHQLLDRADVLVSNLAPGAVARLGVGAADLEQRHPNVIAVEIDGYGPGGPLSHKRAYDLLVQAESGACAITGNPGAPAKPGPPVADISTGLYSALSILALLYSRDAQSTPSQHGNTVGLSLLDTMTELMGYPLTYTQHSGIDQQPLGMSSPAVAPYGAYRTADGQTVVLGTTNDAEWQRLSRQIIQRDDLADDPRFASNSARCAHRDILDEAIGAWCAAHDLDHVQKTADAAGIGNARYNTAQRGPGPPAADRPGPLAAGRHPGRPDPGVAAATRHRRLPGPDGGGARPRAAHGCGARRTRHRRRRNRPIPGAGCRRTGLCLTRLRCCATNATVCGR